jgi:hypothetical protein
MGRPPLSRLHRAAALGIARARLAALEYVRQVAAAGGVQTFGGALRAHAQRVCIPFDQL